MGLIALQDTSDPPRTIYVNAANVAGVSRVPPSLLPPGIADGSYVDGIDARVIALGTPAANVALLDPTNLGLFVLLVDLNDASAVYVTPGLVSALRDVPASELPPGVSKGTIIEAVDARFTTADSAAATAALLDAGGPAPAPVAASGTYAPVLASDNPAVAVAQPVESWKWTRLGLLVTVWGFYDATATAPGDAAEITATLPVAAGANQQVAGVMTVRDEGNATLEQQERITQLTPAGTEVAFPLECATNDGTRCGVAFTYTLPAP